MKKVFLKSMLLLCALIVGSSSAWAVEKSVDITPSQALNDGGVSPIVIACAKGDGTSAPAISSGELRLYQAGSGKTTGNTITFSSSKTITSIVFTCTEGKTPENGSFSVGSYNSENSTWTGSTTSVTLTVTGTTSGKRIYIKGLKVYYEDGDTSPYITAEDVNIAYDATNGSIDYTIGNSVTGGLLTAALTEASDWLTVGAVGASSVAFTSSANTGSARSAIVRLTYTYTDGTEKTVTKDVTITQAKAIINYTYNLASAIIPGRHYIIASGKIGSVKAMGAQASGKSYREEVAVSVTDGSITVSNDAGVYEILIQANEAKGYYTLLDVENNKYLYANSNSSNNINIESELDNNDNGIWSIEIDNNNVATIKAKGKNSRNWIRYNSTDKRFSCYGSGQNNVYLFEKDGDSGSQSVSVSIAEACTDGSKYYATYSSPFGFIIPDGLTVEEIGINNEGKLNVQAYTAGERVPANTGVMISSTVAGLKTLTLAGGGTSVLGSSNRLRSTGTSITAEKMAEADANCMFYRLTMHNGTDIGFWWGAEDGAAFDLAANKAYLAVPDDALLAPAHYWIVNEENGATNIEDIEANEKAVKFIENGRILIKKNGIVYDALGRIVK